MARCLSTERSSDGQVDNLSTSSHNCQQTTQIIDPECCKASQDRNPNGVPTFKRSAQVQLLVTLWFKHIPHTFFMDWLLLNLE